MNNFSDWNSVLENTQVGNTNDLFPFTYELGIDYWFRLKNLRMEFYPEISVQLSTSNSTFGNVELPESYRLEAGGIGIITHIYLFDFFNDCQCPTFSKQNTFLKKGFFVMLGVKEYVQNKETIYSDRSDFHRDFTTQVSGGIGLDVGLTDLITITPFAGLVYYPSTNWEGINANHGIIHAVPPDESTSNLGFQAGIRIGFRPDYLKNR